MRIYFNPSMSFKQQMPKDVQEQEKTLQQLPAAKALTQEQDAYAATKKQKKSGFVEGLSKIAKFFTTLSEMTKAIFKAVGYGALTVAASLTSFWAFGAVPRGLKKGNSIIEAFKHPIKNISKKGKIITGILGLGVVSYHLIKGKLSANQRTANVDHQLKTGHRTT